MNYYKELARRANEDERESEKRHLQKDPRLLREALVEYIENFSSEEYSRFADTMSNILIDLHEENGISASNGAYQVVSDAIDYHLSQLPEVTEEDMKIEHLENRAPRGDE